MCAVCEKMDFAVETLEALFSEDELKEFYWTHMKERIKEFTGVETKEEFFSNPNLLASLHANFISQVWARYCFKKRVHPGSGLNIVEEVAKDVYSRELSIESDPMASELGKLLKRLREYDS